MEGGRTDHKGKYAVVLRVQAQTLGKNPPDPRSLRKQWQKNPATNFLRDLIIFITNTKNINLPR